MKDGRLYAALTLCAVACFAAVFGGPAAFRVVALGAFVIFAPGLVLTHLLRINDNLLSLVIMMMTGPSVWVAIATFAAFSGWWAPTGTVVGAAAVLGTLCLVLMRRTVLGRPEPVGDLRRHRFTAYPTEEGGIARTRKHRGAFPPPHRK